jgi:DNA-directed RNA polymerase specialized sigma24 family protein
MSSRDTFGSRRGYPFFALDWRKYMLCEVPLTKEQQEFAAEHHGLVYKFLNDNHLPDDEFYDVVIFPYLKAVQDYFSDESAQRYSFAAIARHRMRLCVYDYFRSQARRKRNAEILSIHIGLYPDGVPLEELLPAQDDLMQEFEMKQLLHDLAGRVSRQQMNIVRMKGCGYGIREIASREKLPMKRIKELLEEVRTVFLELCYE